MSDTKAYKRILLKLSGEALKGDGNSISPEIVSQMAENINRSVTKVSKLPW